MASPRTSRHIRQLSGYLLWPFTTLTYETAAIVWLLLEVVCLATAVWLLLGLVRRQTPLLAAVVITGALLAWYPVNVDLALGQLGAVLLLLLTGMVLSLEPGVQSRRGFCWG